MNATASPPRAIGEFVRDVVRQLRRAGAVRLEALQEAWCRAAGPQAAQASRVRGAADGVLRVAVRSPALRAELEGFREREILAAMNRELPALAIREVRYRLE